MPLVVGVDSSTTATKLQVRDVDDGSLVASGRADHPDPVRPPRSEADPAVWWEALRAASRAAGPAVAEAVAVSVAAQQHGMIVMDGRGRVLRPAKLWNDTESAGEAAELVRRLGPEVWAASCGSVPVAAFTVTKLAWLRAREPSTWSQVRHVMLPHDWLTWRLARRAVTDRGDASGTGYWSPVSGLWCTDLLGLVDGALEWASLLPEVLGPVEAAGTLDRTAAAELGWRPGAVVGPGTGDNMAAALALGLPPGDVTVSIGTSGTVYTRSEVPAADPSGAVAGFADAMGAFLPLVCTLNATRVTGTMSRLLGVSPEGLDTLALASPAGSVGLTMVPYLEGERTPNLPGATGALCGLRTDVGPGELARASVEGVCCGLLEALDALSAAGVATGGRVLLVGGGARSTAFQRVLADLAGRPLVVPREGELVAAGACVQAAAVWSGTSPAAVAAAWDLAGGPVVAPSPGGDPGEVRARYASTRDWLIGLG